MNIPKIVLSLGMKAVKHFQLQLQLDGNDDTYVTVEVADGVPLIVNNDGSRVTRESCQNGMEKAQADLSNLHEKEVQDNINRYIDMKRFELKIFDIIDEHLTKIS